MSVRLAVSRRSLPLILLAAVALTAGSHPSGENQDSNQKKKPSISVKANPALGFAPLRVVLTAELKGGANDFEDFYCAGVEWKFGEDWGGDSTKDMTAEAKADCDPYEAGKSEIKRRYIKEQTFRIAGRYRVMFRLKQKDRIVGSGQTTIDIREGIGGMDRVDR
jgi:hypothetical protein